MINILGLVLPKNRKQKQLPILLTDGRRSAACMPIFGTYR